MDERDDGGRVPPDALPALYARLYAQALEVLGPDCPQPVSVHFQAGPENVPRLGVLIGFPVGGPGAVTPTAPPAVAPVTAGATAPAPAMTPTQRKLYEAAGAGAVPARKLCRLAGVRPNSRAREALTWLVRARLLVRLPDGLTRPAP